MDDIRQVANRLGASVHQISAHAIQENLEVNLHLEVDSALSLRQAHELATRVEDEIKREFPAIVSVNTHIEPVEANSEIAADELREREWILIELAKITRDLPQVRNVHEVDVHRHDRQLFISLHCILDGALPIGQAHWISGEIEARLKRAHPAIANVTVHTEPDSETTT